MNMKNMANVLLCLFLGIAAAIGLVALSEGLTPKGLFVQEISDIEAGAVDPENQVVLLEYDLERKPRQMVQAHFVIQNGAETAIKNIQVVCDMYDLEQRYRDRDRWLLTGMVPVGEQRIFASVERRFIHTRAARLHCTVVGYDRVAAFEKAGDHDHPSQGDHQEPKSSNGHSRDEDNG